MFNTSFELFNRSKRNQRFLCFDWSNASKLLISNIISLIKRKIFSSYYKNFSNVSLYSPVFFISSSFITQKLVIYYFFLYYKRRKKFKLSKNFGIGKNKYWLCKYVQFVYVGAKNLRGTSEMAGTVDRYIFKNLEFFELEGASAYNVLHITFYDEYFSKIFFVSCRIKIILVNRRSRICVCKRQNACNLVEKTQTLIILNDRFSYFIDSIASIRGTQVFRGAYKGSSDGQKIQKGLPLICIQKPNGTPILEFFRKFLS